MERVPRLDSDRTPVVVNLTCVELELLQSVLDAHRVERLPLLLVQRADLVLDGEMPGVRSVGRVARSQRIDAAQNEFGIAEYWQLWIRPAAGADRPLIAIVPTVPGDVAAVGPAASDANGPTVIVVGRFLKRLAYQSGIGADLAPVVVGKLVAASPVPRGDAATVADADSQIGKPALWLLVALSTIGGLSLAGLAMWRTSATAKRTRQLRRSRNQSPDAFLLSLGQTASEDGGES